MDYLQEQKVIELYKEGNCKNVKKFLKISDTQIYRILKKYSIATKSFKKDEEITKKMIALRKNDIPIREIAKQLDCSYDCVADTLKMRGLQNYVRRKHIEYNPFENYLNPHVQYWLGILSTDGNLFEDTKIQLCQCEDNKDIIFKFQYFLQNKVNIRECVHKKFNKEFKHYCISFRNLEVFEFLSNIIGITPRKTFTLDLKIPITFDFLRGAIDGDGSIEAKYERIRLASASQLFITKVCKLLTDFHIRYSLYESRQTSNGGILYDLQINEHKSVLKLLDYLYYNGCTYLERKYNNAQQIRNYLCTRFKFRELSLENPERNLQNEEEWYIEKMCIYYFMISFIEGRATTIIIAS